MIWITNPSPRGCSLLLTNTTHLLFDNSVGFEDERDTGELFEFRCWCSREGFVSCPGHAFEGSWWLSQLTSSHIFFFAYLRSWADAPRLLRSMNSMNRAGWDLLVMRKSGAGCEEEQCYPQLRCRRRKNNPKVKTQSWMGLGQSARALVASKHRVLRCELFLPHLRTTC